MQLTATQIAQFERDGFVTAPGLFTPDEVTLMRRSLAEIKRSDRPEVVRERTNAAVRLVYGAHRYDDVWRRVCRHPRWLGPAQQLLGSGVYIHQLRINPKAAFDGQGWWWHQDFATWHFEDGLPTDRALMIGLFLDEMHACNGPLMVIPGSHRLGHIEQTQRDHDATGYTVMDLPKDLIARLVRDGGAVQALTGPPGTVLFMHCNLVHGSVGNITPDERTIAYINCASVENRTTSTKRAEWFCNRDHSAIVPLADDCLAEIAEQAA